ncbi:MAG: hypothetical protein HC785_30740 [Calothrix sp. CSU_2_0]|nr:hypothetical protein [Calothrix sp. CSU_2_0]
MAATVKRLKDEGLVLSSDKKAPQRFILWWDRSNGKLELRRSHFWNKVKL